MKKVKLLKGKPLIAAAVNQIIKHPETWDQGQWHCGTTHCIGGWIQILGTGVPSKEDERCGIGVTKDVKRLLEIDTKEAEWLLSYTRTLADIHHFAISYIKGRSRHKFPLIKV